MGNKAALMSGPLKANGLSGADNSFGSAFAFLQTNMGSVLVVAWVFFFFGFVII